tara:strand:+ start:744 stop:1082 length:339 start_codon:yes stop_codon:yes gene_type:complete
MQKKNFESKKLYSFDRNYSAEVLIKQPDKYREIEEFSKANKKIISTGANLSYSPLSFDKNNISILLKKFKFLISFSLKVIFNIVPVNPRPPIVNSKISLFSSLDKFSQPLFL